MYVAPTVPHDPFTPEGTYSGPTLQHDGHTVTVPSFPSPPPPGYFESQSQLAGKPPYVMQNYADAQSFTGDKCKPQVPVSNPPIPGDDYKRCVLKHRDLQFRMLLSMDD